MEQLSKDRLTVRLNEIDSTNSYMKELVESQHPEEGSLVMADYQTVGRGQAGNTWISSKGDNLLFSLLIYPRQVPAKEQFIISKMASLAIKNTLDQFVDDIRIKWPNDIYWKDKKIAGILIESDIQGDQIEHSIIGAGINLNQREFPPELSNPVSLRQITGTEYDRVYVLNTFMREFFLLYRELQRGEQQVIDDEYMLDLYRVNGYHPFEDANGQFRAKIDRILPTGHLVLRTFETDEERVYTFKEVKFLDE